MKLISATQGIVVIRVPADDFAPPNGIPITDLEAALIDTYKASKYVIPQLQALPAGTVLPGAPAIWLQGGHLESAGNRLPIQFILIFQNGLWVSTPSATDNAGAIANHLVTTLDSTFGFRIGASPKEQFWTSHVVVEFSQSFERLASDVQAIAEVVNRAIPRSAANPANRLQFKRFALGYDGHDEAMNTFDNIEWTDFIIERRARTAYSLNRFYSAAPLPTPVHLETLEAIERALAK